jgi:hypothetical protein
MLTISHEQQMDGILLYLDRHGRDGDSLRLSKNADGKVESTRVTLRQLPTNLRLSSLHLQELDLQLQSGNGFEGVLGAGGSPTLKMLCLTNCKLLDGSKGLAAALPQMLDLQHLSVGIKTSITGGWLVSSKASVLQQLTYLELSGMEVQGPRPRDGQPALQPLNALTRLLDLRLKPSKRFCMTGSMLVGPCSLTRLELTNCLIEPEALAGKTKMQHLSLVQCNKSGGAPRQMQLLEQLQYMQQLTHLDLDNTLEATLQTVPFAALTASSKLQVLGIHLCTLPADVWQQVFPAGRQLPGLQKLDISYTSQEAATPSVSTFLLSCCPGLQELHLDIETRGRETVASLRGLSRLHTLHLNAAFQPGDVLREVCQLTGLQQLKMSGFDENEGLLLKLTQLKQLTNLSFTGYLNRYAMGIRLNSQVGHMGFSVVCLVLPWQARNHAHRNT